jgi:UDP-N-acetyl-D-glucosamine dehydrogenase
VRLKELIVQKTATLAVVGLGYVGLPLAIEMVKSGYNVIGVDLSSEKIDQLNEGISYVKDVSNDDVRQAVQSERLRVSTDYAILQEANCISICVPTPLRKTKDPDISYVTYAVNEIMKFLKPETLIVLESTTYPGTSEELIEHEIRNKLGYIVGEDYYVCYSPERVDPGNFIYQTKNTPKVIGGLTHNCIELGCLLYGNIVEHIVPVSSTKVAEMVKLLENTFRSVNIALVNELTLMCKRMGINVWEVIDAAATKPFGFMPFYPGPGIGGHCIPLDPMYLSWKAKTFDFYNKFIELASDMNGNMPRFVLQEVSDVLNSQKKSINGAKIILLGMAYKKDIDDIRESPAIEIYHLLQERGCEVSYHDPFVPNFKNNHGELVHSTQLSSGILRNFDLVIITTNHSFVDYEWVVQNSPLVFDTRNATKGIHRHNIVLLGGHMVVGNSPYYKEDVQYV